MIKSLEASYTQDFLQTKKNYYNNFIKPMKLVRELRLFVLQDVFHTNRKKHSIVDSITKEKVRAILHGTKITTETP